jgi:hypothetical protein
MVTVYDHLTTQGQARYNRIRRKLQFFSTFAGGVVEALRESGFRLCSFEKQPDVPHELPLSSHDLGMTRTSQGDRRGVKSPGRGHGNIELFFEQRDRDQCKVLIVPYRSDLTFLARGRFVAQLGLELSRYCNDPHTLRQAMAVNARTALGGWLGQARIPRLHLDSPPDLKPPGSMTFELRGARLVVSLNVVANLNKYRLSDFELDVDSLGEDMRAYFYGLEKYLARLLESFGSSSAEASPPVAEGDPGEAGETDPSVAPSDDLGAPPGEAESEA